MLLHIALLFLLEGHDFVGMISTVRVSLCSYCIYFIQAIDGDDLIERKGMAGLVYDLLMLHCLLRAHRLNLVSAILVMGVVLSVTHLSC